MSMERPWLPLSENISVHPLKSTAEPGNHSVRACDNFNHQLSMAIKMFQMTISAIKNYWKLMDISDYMTNIWTLSTPLESELLNGIEKLD